MSVNDKILDAIELLAKSSVERAGYDKTIQAQIVSCQDKTIGKYKCKFQDALFYAYTGNPDISLSNGAYVYVLVPENDMSKDKTILGVVDKLGTNYISAAVGDQAYDVIGTNCIQNQGTFYLDIDNVNYSWNIYDADNNVDLVNLDILGFNKYIKQSQCIIVGAKIRTDIDDPLKRYQGHYGISFNLEFQDDAGNVVVRQYAIDEDNMIDNPYNLPNAVRQYVIYDVDVDSFVRVKSINIFNSGFPGASRSQTSGAVQPANAEIFLSQLELKAAVRMTQEQINGIALSLYTPQGTFFTSNDTQSATRTIQGLVKVKGQVAPAAQNVFFYWGYEDVGVTPQSEFYNKNLGRGWHCINEHNVITSQTETQPLIEWLPHNDTYLFPIANATAYDNRIKVAAIYDGNVLTKQINIQNLNIDPDFIKITSSAGNKFYYGVGETSLVCQVQGIYSNLTYKWAWQNNGGLLEPLEGESDFIYTIAGNTLLNLQVSKIYNFGIFKCSVYNGTTYLGTGSITLTNSMQGEGVNPLVINNGTALYKYNEKGISPAARSQQNPQVIQSLSFTLYNEMGNVISIVDEHGFINAGTSVKWAVPKNNTMLVVSDTPNSSDDDYNYYTNRSSLPYDIADRYDVNKINNQIQLYVTYAGATSVAETHLTFVKQGQVGTNGTQYYVKVMPNTLMTNPPQFPMITRLGSTGHYLLNYGLNSQSDSYEYASSINNEPLLKVEFWKNDELITVSSDAITWSVLRNHYYGSENNSIDDYSNFTITDAGLITYTDNLQSQYVVSASNWTTSANIIQCAIDYEGRTYYGTIPFVTAYVVNSDDRISLKDGTGFHYVIYASDGTSPQYSGSYDFEFDPDNSGTCKVLGDIRYYYNDSWNNYQLSNDLLQRNNNNAFDITPVSLYTGECVNNSVRYYISDVGIINVPVHLYLNRYGFAHLNAWDGNSIQINEDEGYILAPQMGAGKKQNDNSFTGVLMGQVKNPMKNQSDIGLFGYAQGARSFFINSKNGSAIFGKSGNGEIIIDPASDKAMLYSHNYWDSYNSQTGLPSSYTNNIRYINEVNRIQNDSSLTEQQKRTQIAALKGGLLIDLTTPQIKFGNGKFYINNQGLLHAQEATISGNITANSLTLGDNVSIGQNYITGLSDDLSALTDGIAVSIKKDGAVSTTSISKWEQNKSYSSNSYVNDNGVIYRCKQYHTSSLYNRPPNNTYWEEDIPSSTFLVSSNGLLTANNAVIYGTLYSSFGEIGGWTIGNNKLYTGTLGASDGIYFMSNGYNTATINNTQRHDWAITAGANFGVTRSGGLYSKNAIISGEITATNGFIGDGGNNSWVIGGDSSRGWIHTKDKTTLIDSDNGIYIGTDGISMYGSNKKIFQIDTNNGTAYFDGQIKLSSSSTISFGYDDNPTIGELTNDIQGVLNGTSISNNHHLIRGTFIDGKTIAAPIITGGEIRGGIFKASNTVGDEDPMMLFYNGTSKAGRIGYVPASTNPNYAQHLRISTYWGYSLKLISAKELSLQAQDGYIYTDTLIRMDKGMATASGIGYGSSYPNYPVIGQIFFKI